MTPAEEHAKGFIRAKHVANYLLRTYLKFSYEDAAWYWSDFGARDSYHDLCTLWGLRREG
jgi:hypothetical protein